jgi:hypothetical protein
MTRGAIIVAGTTVIATTVLAYRLWDSKAMRFRRTQLLDSVRVEPVMHPDKILKPFRRTELDEPAGNSANPHKNAAAARTAAVGFMRTICLKLGVLESSISMSARDQRDGVNGTRSYFWAKDVDKAPANNDVGPRSYVDVDYHIQDLENDLAGRSDHSLIYTIIPRKAASSGEVSHTFNTDGSISVVMKGGGSYSHHLWDWNPDVITCSKRFLGIAYATTIYKVEKKTVGELKAMVLLAPIGSYFGLWAMLADGLETNRLTRLNCVNNGFAHVKTVTSGGVKHSIAPAGAYTSADLSTEEYDTMVQAASMGKQDPTTAAMASWCNQEREKAVMVASYFRARDGDKAPFVTTADESVKAVSANVNTHGDTLERVSVQGFMQPIVAGNCYAHTDHQDNASWAAESRVTDLKPSKVQILNPFVAAAIAEFAALTVPKAVTEADLQTVYEKQNRPTQRAIIAEAVDMGPSERTSLKAFLKKEAYQGAKDPRIITTYRPGVKVGYSVYMYALTDQLKQHQFYGFLTPEQVAARVASICVSQQDYVIEGDFSRMDGRVDVNVRETFEKALICRAFPNDNEVHRLHDLQYGQTVILGTGTYDQGYARGSGSPETSVFNTALTGFVMFLAGRMSGLDKDEAFASIGIVAGDDSLQGGHSELSAERYSKYLERAARAMGQVLTSDIKRVGEPVQFLSRYFGGAWVGDLNSMSCPLRLLSKVHCAVNIGIVLPEDKCREKGESILSGDSNTPIIGDLARKMTSVGRRLEGEQKRIMNNWWTQFEDCSWPNVYDSWMEDVIEKEMPGFDYTAFDKWCESGDALLAPTCYVVTPKPHARALLVDGDLVVPTKSQGKKPRKAVPGTRNKSRPRKFNNTV